MSKVITVKNMYPAHRQSYAVSLDVFRCYFLHMDCSLFLNMAENKGFLSGSTANDGGYSLFFRCYTGKLIQRLVRTGLRRAPRSPLNPRSPIFRGEACRCAAIFRGSSGL